MVVKLPNIKIQGNNQDLFLVMKIPFSISILVDMAPLLLNSLPWNRRLPAGGITGFSSYVLPGFTLGWFVVAGMMRLLRSGMLEVLDSEYVKLARVKGVIEPRVVWMHALKNALIPVVTFAGIYFAILVTTAIVVETVFAWPGLGRLAYDGITSRDFPVIQAVVLTTAVIVAGVNLCVDLLYAFIDPRIIAIAWVSIFIVVFVHVVRLTWGRPRPLLA